MRTIEPPSCQRLGQLLPDCRTLLVQQALEVDLEEGGGRGGMDSLMGVSALPEGRRPAQERDHLRNAIAGVHNVKRAQASFRTTEGGATCFGCCKLLAAAAWLQQTDAHRRRALAAGRQRRGEGRGRERGRWARAEGGLSVAVHELQQGGTVLVSQRTLSVRKTLQIISPTETKP